MKGSKNFTHTITPLHLGIPPLPHLLCTLTLPICSILLFYLLLYFCSSIF